MLCLAINFPAFHEIHLHGQKYRVTICCQLARTKERLDPVCYVSGMCGRYRTKFCQVVNQPKIRRRTIMFRPILGSLTALLLCSTFIFAQNGPTHLMGAVTAVKPDMVTIKTQNGKSEIVALEKTTKYMKDGKQAKSADLKVGDTIMINAKMDAKTKKYAAEEVTLGEKDAKAKAAPAKK